MVIEQKEWVVSEEFALSVCEPVGNRITGESEGYWVSGACTAEERLM